MAIDRIPAAGFLPPVHNRPGNETMGGTPPMQAALLAAEVQAVAEGLPLPQAGGTALTAEAPDPSASDAAAMRPNQLFFARQVVWQSPDATTLAASWQVMVRTYGKLYAALLDQARGQHLPASLFMAGDSPLALRDGPAPPMTPEPEPWRFWVYAWARQRLMLRVLARDPEQGAAPRQRRARIALRLELMVPGVGLVMIQMEPAGNGIVLDLAAPHPPALAHLRDMLPKLAAAIARAGLTIVRCRRVHVLPLAASYSNVPTQAQAAALSLPMFEAMAEVALLLSRPPSEEAPVQWASMN